jgi:hypothetical protein
MRPWRVCTLSISTSKSGHCRTRAATEAQLARFKTAEERSHYFRELGKQSQAGRIVLTGDQADALRQAYAFLRSIAPKLEQSTQTDESTA